MQGTVKNSLDAMRDFGTDDVLAALGLARRRTPVDIVIPATGAFVAGLVIGAGIAVLVAPNSGRETRRVLRGWATDLSNRLSSSAHEIAEGVRGAVRSAEEALPPHNGGGSERKSPAQTHSSGPQSSTQR